MPRFTIIDVSTAPIPECGEYLDDCEAPANYKDPEKIAAYKAEARQKALDKAALDPDLCRITGIGLMHCGVTVSGPDVSLCRDEDEEREALTRVTQLLAKVAVHYAPLVGYNALRFDWPVLQRRAWYLGVPLILDVDRYRTPHVDLSERLTQHGMLQSKSLGFYAKRLQWTDLQKPLSGAEEARVHETGQWDELRASLVHDVTATFRLAQWLGIVERDAVPA